MSSKNILLVWDNTFRKYPLRNCSNAILNNLTSNEKLQGDVIECEWSKTNKQSLSKTTKIIPNLAQYNFYYDDLFLFYHPNMFYFYKISHFVGTIKVCYRFSISIKTLVSLSFFVTVFERKVLRRIFVSA